MKVMIFMCGEGLGHTSRCLAVGKKLMDNGFNVLFCAYGYSKKLIDDSGFNSIEIPSEIKLVGKGGSLDMRESIEETLKKTYPLMYPKIVGMIKKERPGIIISDSYFAAVVAAKVQKIPTIFIINQTNVGNFFLNRGLDVSIIGNLVVKFADIVHKQVDRIIIPDFPPPYTVCARNAELKSDIVDKVVYCGPLVRENPCNIKEEDVKKPHVFCSIGGFGYRKRLLQNIIEAAGYTKDMDYTLVTGPNVSPESLGNVPSNVSILGYLKNPFPYIKASDVVIAAGGHSTLMECLSFGKPILSFPDMFHSEQENNAQRIDELELGKMMSYFTPPFMISECINDARSYRKNTEKLMRYADRLKGPERVLREVEELTQNAHV